MRPPESRHAPITHIPEGKRLAVLFLHPYQNMMPGDIGGYPREIALKLIKSGIADLQSHTVSEEVVPPSAHQPAPVKDRTAELEKHMAMMAERITALTDAVADLVTRPAAGGALLKK
jgi:hypothetical protein